MVSKQILWFLFLLSLHALSLTAVELRFPLLAEIGFLCFTSTLKDLMEHCNSQTKLFIWTSAFQSYTLFVNVAALSDQTQEKVSTSLVQQDIAHSYICKTRVATSNCISFSQAWKSLMLLYNIGGQYLPTLFFNQLTRHSNESEGNYSIFQQSTSLAMPFRPS